MPQACGPSMRRSRAPLNAPRKTACKSQRNAAPQTPAGPSQVQRPTGLGGNRPTQPVGKPAWIHRRMVGLCPSRRVVAHAKMEATDWTAMGGQATGFHRRIRHRISPLRRRPACGLPRAMATLETPVPLGSGPRRWRPDVGSHRIGLGHQHGPHLDPSSGAPQPPRHLVDRIELGDLPQHQWRRQLDRTITGDFASLEIDPSDPDHLLAAEFGNDIAESHDAGATWDGQQP